MTLETAIRASEVELPDVEDAFGWFEHIDKVCEVTSIMTGAPLDALQQIKPENVIWLFVDKLLPLVREFTSDTPDVKNIRVIDSFTHKGKKYYLPESLPIFDDVVLSHGQTAKRFVEASNLFALYSKMRKSGIQTMPLFVSSIVRESKDEVWNEKIVAERAKDMLTLPMDVFWDVFFCISARTVRQMSDTLRSMLEVDRVKEKKVIPATRHGLLALRRQELREAWSALMG